MRHLVALLMCFAAFACNSPDARRGGGSGGGADAGDGIGGGGGTGGSGGSDGTGGSGGGGDLGSDGCSEAAKLIYVIDQDGTLSSFSPNQTDVTQSVFTDIGKPSCPVASGYQPFSMSIDRDGTAWVEYTFHGVFGGGGANQLFQVSTTDASCKTTAFMGNQQGFSEFGMGFVSNSSGSTDETLYIAGGADLAAAGMTNLGTLDTTSFAITKGSALTGNPELTGNGLAELWGFFPDASMPRVSKIDKTSGAESSSIPLGTDVAGDAAAWAFAFYGGDFWVFLAKNGAFTAQPTVVYHVTTAGVKDSLDTKTRHIVGAGVSTCAPTVPIS